MFNRKNARLARELVKNPYAWPGGYPIYAVLADGELLCPDCAKSEFRELATASDGSGWIIAGLDILYEDFDNGDGTFSPELCVHCRKELESAYGGSGAPGGKVTC